MKANVYKITLMVVDFENYGRDEVQRIIENCRGLSPTLRDVQVSAVEWEDSHPLNKMDTWQAEFDGMFPVQPQGTGGGDE